MEPIIISQSIQCISGVVSGEQVKCNNNEDVQYQHNTVELLPAAADGGLSFLLDWLHRQMAG
jgi:hypothetical protein